MFVSRSKIRVSQVARAASPSLGLPSVDSTPAHPSPADPPQPRQSPDEHYWQLLDMGFAAEAVVGVLDCYNGTLAQGAVAHWSGAWAWRGRRHSPSFKQEVVSLISLDGGLCYLGLTPVGWHLRFSVVRSTLLCSGPRHHHPDKRQQRACCHVSPADPPPPGHR